MRVAQDETGKNWSPRCWACGNQLGTIYGHAPSALFRTAIVEDRGGEKHLTHLNKCARDADGREVGVLKVRFVHV